MQKLTLQTGFPAAPAASCPSCSVAWTGTMGGSLKQFPVMRDHGCPIDAPQVQMGGQETVLHQQQQQQLQQHLVMVQAVTAEQWHLVVRSVKPVYLQRWLTKQKLLLVALAERPLCLFLMAFLGLQSLDDDHHL